MMGFSAETWIALVALLFSIVGPGVVWFFRSTAKDEIESAIEAVEKRNIDAHRERKVELSSVKDTVIDHDRRIIRVEEAIKALPTKRDIDRLTDSVANMAGDMKKLAADVHALNASLDRTERAVGVINETLMQRQ